MTRSLVLGTLSLTIALMPSVHAGPTPAFAPRITHASHTQVAEAVRLAAVPGQRPVELVPQDWDLNIRVNVARKVTNRMAEVHATYGHLFYIQEGSGTVVLGGELVEPTENRPGEWTGTGVTGGREVHVQKGDMVTVQVGMPHWWKETGPEGVVFIAFHSYPERNRLPATQR
ncbi:MAG: hypothetical protein FJW23_09085 [Acidimicrobiia bacterium]|nr:hypothetical protein [Acidimicrobiia bacterium]